jgi:hypothetical protein
LLLASFTVIPNNKLIELIPDFLSAIAPGGLLSPEARHRLREAFLRVNDGVFSQQLLKIEELFKAWAVSDCYDAVDTVKNIMLTIKPSENLTWISFHASDRPPGNGFFVDMQFEVKEPEP